MKKEAHTLERLPPSGQLPISSIRGSNPTWIRGNLTEIDELAASLTEEGMLLPIMVTHDLLMVDGARRLEAAARLGWDLVPVLIDPTWDQVMAYYRNVRLLTVQGHPPMAMTWLELTDVWNGGLRELFAPERTRRMTSTKRATGAKRAAGMVVHPEPRDRTSGYNGELGTAFELRFGVVKIIRGIRASIETYASSPTHSGYQRNCRAAEEVCNRFNADMIAMTGDPRTTQGLGFLRTAMQELARGEIDLPALEAQLQDFTERLQLRSKNQPPVQRTMAVGRIRVVVEKPDITTAAGRLVAMIQDTATEAAHFDVAAAGMDPATARNLSHLVQSSVNQINRLKRKLIEHGQLEQADDPTSNPTN